MGLSMFQLLRLTSKEKLSRIEYQTNCENPKNV
jgi:hypothetical protein